MKYFSTITSLGDLKKQYRDLAKANHPDLGGDTRIMQEINNEFSLLFDVWKDRKEMANNGYDTDFQSATAQEYASYVYDEYRWKGSRYDRNLHGDDLSKIFRKWCKETYPNCKFSVRQGTGGWTKSFYINLYEADFHPFKDITETHSDINHYCLNESHDELTDRAVEVMSNVIQFVQSYNYDNSNIMEDYFDVNFYVHFEIGSHSKHFTYKPIAIKSDKPIRRKKIGNTQKMINEAMRGCKWCANRRYSEKMILCISDDSNCPYALYSNNDNLIPKKVKTLNEIGIMCHLEKHLIVFDRYSDELQRKLNEDEKNIDMGKVKKNIEINNDSVQIIDYSEKAIAVIGDTKPIKDMLKNMGGKFNPRLSCGMGWIFPKNKMEQVKAALSY